MYVLCVCVCAVCVCVCVSVCVCVCVCVSPVGDRLQWDPPGGTRGCVEQTERTLRETGGADKATEPRNQQTHTRVHHLKQHLDTDRLKFCDIIRKHLY